MEFQADLEFAKVDKHGKPDSFENHLKRLMKKTEKPKKETVNRVQVFPNDFMFTKPEKKGPRKFEIPKIEKVMKTNTTHRGICLVYPGDKPENRWIVGLRFKTAQGYTDFINKLEQKAETEPYIPSNQSVKSASPSSTSSSTPPAPIEKKKKKQRKSHSLDVRTIYIDTEKLRQTASHREDAANHHSYKRTTFTAASGNRSPPVTLGNGENCRMKRLSGAIVAKLDESGRPIHPMPCKVYKYVCDRNADCCSTEKCEKSQSRETYEQIKGTPVDSSVSGFVAEMILQELEKIAFVQHEAVFWRRYVDNTFVFVKKDMLQHLHSLLNAVFHDIKFTREEEQEQQLPFLNVLVRRNLNGELETTVYRKGTNTTQLLSFHSNHPVAHERSCVKTLFKRI
ncbi:hypothetical protein SprV_0100195900 [Sparganum proliferum]